MVALLVWTWRASAAGHPARRGAVLSLVFILTEAAVGAGLVLFELVADNQTMARAMFMAAHLVNTFLLVAVLTLTAWWLSGGGPTDVRARPGVALVWGGLAIGLLLAGTSGAVAALGDTLYPAASHAEGFAATRLAQLALPVRLRALHPLIAVTAGVLLMAVAPRLPEAADAIGQRLGRMVLVAAGVQLLGGLLNLLLLAPVWMQIVHLLVADLLWIAFVVLGAHVLRRNEPSFT